MDLIIITRITADEALQIVRALGSDAPQITASQERKRDDTRARDTDGKGKDAGTPPRPTGLAGRIAELLRQAKKPMTSAEIARMLNESPWRVGALMREAGAQETGAHYGKTLWSIRPRDAASEDA